MQPSTPFGEDSSKVAEDAIKLGSPLDLTDAEIVTRATFKGQKSRDAPSISLPHQQAEQVGHIALDIGGSLIKLVYFSPEDRGSDDGAAGDASRDHSTGGRMHFVKFETSAIDQAIEFILAKGLHQLQARSHSGRANRVRVKATGGGAYKFAEALQERLEVLLEKEDEMQCLVIGCDFLLKAVRHEAFTYEKQQAHFSRWNADSELYPYLLVNVGSGVSMIKVTGNGQFERVSGSSMGGGTFWGLCRLLTRVRAFDEMLELSMQGDNSKVDMLVGDIYGNRDYSSIGLSASTIASSFGKVVSSDKELEDYSPADLCLALCRMVSYNIGHLAYLNAKRYNLKRVFFGGFFIRGHPYTMDTLSFAIQFWSKGEMAAMFLRHEGYLGALGAFLKAHPMTPSSATTPVPDPRKVRARFTERFSMGAPISGGQVSGPAFSDMDEKVSWVEKFVRLGEAAASQAAEVESADWIEDLHLQWSSEAASDTPEAGLEAPLGELLEASPRVSRMNMHVGVLHYDPSCEYFPLLADPVHYTPDTQDINKDREEMGYWLGAMQEGLSTLVAKASASEHNKPGAQRRAAAFAKAFTAHLTKVQSVPGAYGELGLADVFEMREECLREFGFTDVYRMDKDRENTTALEVLPDLLRELDTLDPHARLTALVEGVLAANIFDWGARECVELYRNGTILEIYRKARTTLAKRPWRVDDFEGLKAAWFAKGQQSQMGPGDVPRSPFKRVIMFVDNAGADVVLGMLPLARELLRGGAEVVLVANSQPAINDVTAPELRRVLEAAASCCPVIAAARESALKALEANDGRMPPLEGLPPRIRSYAHLQELEGTASGSSSSQHAPFPRQARLYVVGNGQGSPCLDLRRVPDTLADATIGADLVILEGMGRAIHTNLRTRFKCPSLKLAMIKNARLASRLFGGQTYDCLCMFEAPATPAA
ncbi:hypothetical protein WJX73_008823 [Symbiochloris irregularis]|uniref:pantothenate kinase n=1 Tax=Symbiochloris irregularis TaxID=706552 RepID=A0AAW1NY96_9CHLO